MTVIMAQQRAESLLLKFFFQLNEKKLSPDYFDWPR